jgi:hypothetical protein
MLYTAIIIEPRQHKALPFVLENFLNNLSEDWSFIIFHGKTNLEFIVNIINDKLYIFMHRIRLINLNVDNLTINAYNNLLKYNKSFYDCIPTETFLIFQTDSIIMKKYKNIIYNFLNYDYVGAPFFFNNNINVGNGGLSLRKKSKMIEIMKKEGKNNRPEDVYFSCCESVAIYKPSVNDAMLFSIEETFSEMSFGCHKPWKNSNQLFLYEKYDEVKELYMYNDILSPQPVVSAPKPKPIVAPPPQPVVSEPKPKPIVAPPPQPVVSAPKPKPIVAPPPQPVVSAPKPKPIVAPVVPNPEVNSNSKGYKIAHVDKEHLKELYNYQNYKHNIVSSSSSKTTQSQSTTSVINNSKSVQPQELQEQDAMKPSKFNLTSLSSNFQHKFKYK